MKFGLMKLSQTQVSFNRYKLISFFNTQTQKINSQLGSTEKIFVENISDRSAQLGKQLLNLDKW